MARSDGVSALSELGRIEDCDESIASDHRENAEEPMLEMPKGWIMMD